MIPVKKNAIRYVKKNMAKVRRLSTEGGGRRWEG